MAHRRRCPGSCLLIVLTVASPCSDRLVRADGPAAGAGLGTTDAMNAFAGRSWRIISTSLEIGGKSKTTKGGDQGILVIDGDRFLILDPSSKVYDQGRFEPRGGRHVQFRNLDGVMELAGC
jgi:hypothetical protein